LVANRELHKKHQKDIKRLHRHGGPRNSGFTNYEQLDNESRQDNNSHHSPKGGRKLRNTGWKNWEPWYEKTKENTDIYAKTKPLYNKWKLTTPNFIASAPQVHKELPVLPSYTDTVARMSAKDSSTISYPSDELNQIRIQEEEEANTRAMLRGIPFQHESVVVCSNFQSGEDSRPIFPVRINKRKVMALLDTGSQSTLIDARMLSPKEKEDVVRSDIKVIGVDGNFMPLLGILKCNISLLNQSIEHSVKVMENNTNECIIGMDLMSKIKGLTLNLNIKKLSVGTY